MSKSFLTAGVAAALSAVIVMGTAEFAFARGPGNHGGNPHGFSQGNKMGWHGASTPPGWSHGRKTGWNGARVPPGWQVR